MFKSFVAATCALGLATCVPNVDQEEISATSELKGAATSCITPIQLTQPVPPLVAWTGTLPPVFSPDVVWMLTPLDGNGTDWALDQVEVNKDFIVSRTKLSSGQRPEVLKQLGMMLATIGGVRIGGPRPGPIGDPAEIVSMANDLRNRGF